MKIIKLRCNYMENPVGFDFDRPTLNWVTQAEGRNKVQTAYRLQVALHPDFSEILMDTGKVESDKSIGFRLEMPLEACTRYFWRVNVWDESGNETGFSDAAYFETARYGRPWKAEWIGSSMEYPQLRKGFSIDNPIVRARAYASGAGIYRLFLNGAPVSDELLTPGINAYDLWMQYQTYDVTDLLSQGENVVGAWLGNGYYKGRVNWPGVDERREIYGKQIALIMELDIEYADGSRETIITDESWQAAPSPYLRAEVYDGEVFDARLLDDEWCKKTGDGEAAQIVPINKELLHARMSVPVKVMHTLPVKEKIITPAGEQVLDFGQNFAGLMRIRVNAPAGTEICFQAGETLDEKGNFYRDNMRTALAELRYICDGKEREYAPNFTFFGFRYLRVSGWEINAEDVTAQVIYSGMERTGYFSCSDERVNRLFENAIWSQRSNFVDVPTDCPQRDERMGWTGDAQVFCPTALMNMESGAFFRKYLFDLKKEQDFVGYVPVVVPNILRGSGLWEFPTTGWGDAAVLIPWDLYLYYGDMDALETQYASMKAWVDYITAQDEKGNHLYEGFHLGDWLAQDTKDPDNFFGLTPPILVATAYYAWSAETLSKAAKVLGKEEDAAAYADLAEKVRAAFRKEFVSESGRVSSETQTAYLLALNMDMLLPEQREKAAACLAERIEIDRVQLTTGFIGTPYLCPVLTEAGLNEYAYALLLQNKCPSWLYEVEMGATTVWERWNSIRPDGTMGPVNMNSLNHYAFGAVAEWLYRYVVGINPVEADPGYKQIRIRPQVNDMLGHAEASIDTPHGIVKSGWKLDGDTLELQVTIPFNTRAEIILPDTEGAEILENGAPLVQDSSIIRGSGSWCWQYKPNGNTIHRRIQKKELPRF